MVAVRNSSKICLLEPIHHPTNPLSCRLIIINLCSMQYEVQLIVPLPPCVKTLTQDSEVDRILRIPRICRPYMFVIPAVHVLLAYLP